MEIGTDPMPAAPRSKITRKTTHRMQAMRPCDDRDAEDAVIDEDLSSISTLSGGCGKKAGAI